ncbi:MAG: phosphopantetheine-binding protein [Bacteroidota bacterium]
MIAIDEFITKVEGEFDDMKPGLLNPESIIREHLSWDSINALIFIAHVNVEYDVVISADDLVSSNTVQDLYNLVSSKANAV